MPRKNQQRNHRRRRTRRTAATAKREPEPEPAGECDIEHCEGKRDMECGSCGHHTCAACCVGCLRVYKHPADIESKSAAIGVKCPFCRTGNPVAFQFTDLQAEAECELKGLLARAGQTAVDVACSCAEGCGCGNAPIMLAHDPCEEGGCYGCYGSRIRVSMSQA